MNASKNILVTGGAGYIGSHTVVDLVQSGFNPIIVDDFRNAHNSILNGIEKIVGQKVQIREIDICDKNKLSKVFEEFPFSGIIHFAAYKAVGESVENPLSYYSNNINGLINVLELAIKYNVKNVVFSSSCTIYGEPKGQRFVTENSPIQPASSPYGNTKQIGEQIIDDVIKSGKNIKVLNLRYFNPVGAHSSSLIGEYPIGKPNNLLPVVTQVGIGKLPEIIVNGEDYDTIDGTCVRDYVHVCDLADAHVKGIEWLSSKVDPIVESVNIGTGKGTSILEIIETFENVSNRKLNWKFGPRREGDVVEIYADASKAMDILNWKSSKTVKDAIIDAWNWELKLKNG